MSTLDQSTVANCRAKLDQVPSTVSDVSLAVLATQANKVVVLPLIAICVTSSLAVTSGAFPSACA